MKRIQISYMLYGAMLLGTVWSCKLGKPYVRPDLEVPANYREHQVTLTADTLLLPWKDFFEDPLLVDLIEEALRKNQDVEVALLNLRQMELQYQQAKRGLLPTVDFAIGANRNWLSSNSLNGSLSEQFVGTKYMDDYSANLAVSWEADLWGKVKLQKEGAWADFFAQQENVVALKTRLISQVAQAYYNLAILDEQLMVAQQNIALAEETLRVTGLQFKSGQANSVAVQQAEAQKKTAELLVPLAQQQIQVQENALRLLCGAYPESVKRQANALTFMKEKLFPSGIPATLLSRRPDLKMAEYTVMSAHTQIGLAKVAMYPSLSLTPSIGTNSFNLNNWFDLPGSLVKNVGANIAQPIFRKKTLKTAYDIAVLEREKKVLQYKQTLITAVAEVSDAFATMDFADQRISLAEAKTQALQKALKDASLLYENGMANYLEVIVAQSAHLQHDLDVLAMRKEKLDATINLYRALGGGVE